MDGLGIAWYTNASSSYTSGIEGLRPALYKSQSPPTNDINFRSLCENTESVCILAHIRATLGSPVTPINNHPFVFGRHAFMHNGTISDFQRIRSLMTNLMSFDAYNNVRGTTDTEHAAALYMTFLTGYGDQSSWQRSFTANAMKIALVRTVITIMELQRNVLGKNATPNGLNLCVTDGRKLVACRFRNCETEDPASLYWSQTAGGSLNRKYPGDPDESRPQYAEDEGYYCGHITSYDVETVHSIINSTPVAHVSFIPDDAQPKPVILPMIARIGQFPNAEEPACYIHGYVSARLFRTRTNETSPAEDGFPICVAASKVDAINLSLTPFTHGFDYRSAIIHGHATILDSKTDPDELLWALQLITDGIVPQRWDNSRSSLDDAELASTRIIKVSIDTASAKIHDSGVKEKAKDLADEKSRKTVWTGTLPYIEMLGTPIPAETNMVAAVPPYLTDYIREHNAQSGYEGYTVTGMLSGLVSWIFGR
ncbi:N-terminal nucleophile aminohydrolase [Annulohypoxylon moriforme]|nr:N-terminal nucleophile aminohydrolase [Annulohypoxylon moriforme]